MCTKSLFRKNCFISSGIPAESPHKSKHLVRWTVPGSMLMSCTFGRRNHTAWKSSHDKIGVKNVSKRIHCFVIFVWCTISWYNVSSAKIITICAKFGIVFVYCLCILILCKVLWLNSEFKSVMQIHLSQLGSTLTPRGGGGDPRVNQHKKACKESLSLKKMPADVFYILLRDWSLEAEDITSIQRPIWGLQVFLNNEYTLLSPL